MTFYITCCPTNMRILMKPKIKTQKKWKKFRVRNIITLIDAPGGEWLFELIGEGTCSSPQSLPLRLLEFYDNVLTHLLPFMMRSTYLTNMAVSR